MIASAHAIGWAPGPAGEVRTPIAAFVLVSTAPGACATSRDVCFDAAIAAAAPGTVARALADAGRLDLERPPPLDAQDHWYRAQLPASDGAPRVLVCEGLATLAEIWIDGQLCAQSESMFVAQTLALPPAASELVICFRALAPVLAKRRPRPRWRTRLVESQNLRFVRTSLLGRMPGLGPALPAVGPTRPIYLATCDRVRVIAHVLRADGDGRVTVQLRLRVLDRAMRVAGAHLHVAGAAGAAHAALTSERVDEDIVLSGAASVSDLRRWWPHTHGAQPLSMVTVALDDGTRIALGQVGFRSLRIDRGEDGEGFGLLINDVPVFARGACFTTSDFLTLGSAGLRETLALAKRAGMNMLRIPGIACYAPDALHALCDELGIMVFQDLMLANMDYPAGDPTFDAALSAEVDELLTRIGGRPSTVVVCGGSEVAQQVAMLGLDAQALTSALYDETLAARVHDRAPSVAYVSNSPSGGALPFHVDAGIGHYYGVGAYLRPLDDLRRSRVRFAAECLAFSNIPHPDTVEALMGDDGLALHHPRWKARVPRDRGASWDFEDVRDHYVAHFFGVDARLLRTTDPERYLALGHAAVGEAISAAYAEWRAHGSSCCGALIFWLRDHLPGAGFGLIDANGRPKSAYYFAARSFAPRYVGLTDEGLNGLTAHLCNDHDREQAAELRVSLYRDGDTLIAEGRTALALKAHGVVAVRLDRLLPRFADPTYAYRFGPPPHDLVVATLLVDGAPVARAFYLPLGLARPLERDLGLSGVLETSSDAPVLTVQTRCFAQCVRVDVPGYLPDDDYFHLAPGEVRRIFLRPLAAAAGAPRGRLSALNARAPGLIAVGSDSREGAS